MLLTGKRDCNMKRNIKITAEACSLQTGSIIEVFLNF